MLTFGKVAEWSIASDLKSDEAKASVSSNLTLSVVNLEIRLQALVNVGWALPTI
jgi:hypothetical protein